MIIVDDKLVSDELLQEEFVCNLDACKGACCWEGDYGAPLEEAEKATLDRIYEDLRPFLTEAGQRAIAAQGKYVFYTGDNVAEWGTTLVDNAACAYMTMRDGKAQCGIEAAYNAGVVDFKKPVSCHLYPIRVSHNPKTGFEALNYDRWDICSAACTLGERLKVPIFQFVKEALIRKYGVDFYEQLEGAAAYLQQTDADEPLDEPS